MTHTYYSMTLMLHILFKECDSISEKIPVYYTSLRGNPTLEFNPLKTIFPVHEVIAPGGGELDGTLHISKSWAENGPTVCIGDFMRELDKICESYPVEATCMPLIVNCIYGEGQAKSAPKEAVNIFIVETMALHNHAYPKTLKDGRGNIRLVLIVTP